MTNTLRIQHKLIFNRSNLPRSNSVPNYTPDFIIPPYSLFNNFSFSSTIIFYSVPIISVPSSIVPAIITSSNVTPAPIYVPASIIVPSSIVPNISGPSIVPTINSSSIAPNIYSAIPAAVIPSPVIPNTSSSTPNISNSLANSQHKNISADSIVNPSKDEKISKKSNKPKLSIKQQIKISKKNIRFGLKRIGSVLIFKERRLKNLLG
jgi:hypothetical protein